MSPKEYLNVIRPYLTNLINDHKPIMEVNNNNNNTRINTNTTTNNNNNNNNNNTNTTTNIDRAENSINNKK